MISVCNALGGKEFSVLPKQNNIWHYTPTPQAWHPSTVQQLLTIFSHLSEELVVLPYI